MAALEAVATSCCSTGATCPDKSSEERICPSKLLEVTALQSKTMEDEVQEAATTTQNTVLGESALAGSQAAASSNGQPEEAGADSTTPTTAADTELEGLAFSSAITELGYALEAVSTLIFEIQVRVLLCLLCNGGTKPLSRRAILRETSNLNRVIPRPYKTGDTP